MAASWIVEAVDIFEVRHLSRPGCLPRMTPDQFSFDGLEERFHGSVVVTITFAAHRHFEVMLAQDLLIIVRTVLAATISVMPSRQITL